MTNCPLDGSAFEIPSATTVAMPSPMSSAMASCTRGIPTKYPSPSATTQRMRSPPHPNRHPRLIESNPPLQPHTDGHQSFFSKPCAKYRDHGPWTQLVRAGLLELDKVDIDIVKMLKQEIDERRGKGGFPSLRSTIADDDHIRILLVQDLWKRTE